jgi:predicted 3-demethylubiquinone-9 3-methyltransferase (glyoxalase superfamily)
MPRITPFLWFDTQAEAAAQLYTSVFPNSRITNVNRVAAASPHGESSVLLVEFELDGQPVIALNGGPAHQLTEAFSLSVDCQTQAEVDRYWEQLAAGGEEGPCGWLKDRFGLSWQIVPRRLGELLGDPDPAKAQRVAAAMLQMRKLDIAALEWAADAS